MSYSLKALNDAVRSDPKGYAEECDAIFAQKVENAAKRIADHRSESHVILLSGPSGSGNGRASVRLRVPLFSARVWTVMLSVPKSRHRSRDRRKPASVSSGSPAIRSMFTQPKPTSRARA